MFDFPLVCESSDSNGFLDKWPAFSQRLPEAMRLLGKPTFTTKWNKDVKTILMILKLLPIAPARKNPQAKRVPASATADCLISFVKVCTKYHMIIFVYAILKNTLMLMNIESTYLIRMEPQNQMPLTKAKFTLTLLDQEEQQMTYPNITLLSNNKPLR